jgi:hypothetical protein
MAKDSKEYLFEEWKECRFSIDRFDRLLVDLRKTGFGFVTALVGAAAFIFGGKAETQVQHMAENTAISALITLLITTLYFFDYKHQVWLRGAVSRASTLETPLDFKLTTHLSSEVHAEKAGALGLLLYAVLLLFSTGFFWFAVQPVDGSWWSVNRLVVGGAGIVGLLAMIFSSHWKYPFNRDSFNVLLSLGILTAFFLFGWLAERHWRLPG